MIVSIEIKAIEPLADDLASLGLDVLVGEEGFARVPNPFVLGIMSQHDEGAAGTVGQKA